jgi:hypothetical protein
LWPRDPGEVSRDYRLRHGADPPQTLQWAVWAAEGTDYLEKLDAGHPGGDSLVPPCGFKPDMVDMAHVRWATGNAITAIDLCAATIGRLFCGPIHGNELSLRSFDPACAARYQTAVNGRRSSLPRDFLAWLDDTLADQRYIDLRSARNPFTHSWLQRHLFIGGSGHTGRSQFTVVGTSLQTNARDMVVASASLAIDRVRAFVEVVDQH